VLEAFFKLCQKANTWDRRKTLLRALMATSQAVLSSFVAQNGMYRVLQGWLEEALETDKTEFVSSMLTTLSQMPATQASLKSPCALGRIVNVSIPKNKSMDDRTISESKMIIAKWKKLFPESQKKKRPADGQPGETQTKPAHKKKMEVNLKDVKPSDGLEDVDFFAGQGKSSKRQNATRPAASATTTATAAKATTRVRIVASNAALPQQSTARVAPKATQVAKVSTNPLDMLGMNREPDSQPVAQPTPSQRQRRTVLARATDSLPLVAASAAEKAKAAAERVPDEPPREKRKTASNRRKVVWADGWGPETPPLNPQKLVAERTFLKTDPPCKASADAVYDAEAVRAAGHQDLREAHQQFEMAARQQHHSEAQALKDFKAKEDQERREVEQRLSEIRPTVPWRDAPSIPDYILADLDYQPARGENSVEANVRMQARSSLPAASYALDSPEEPPPGSSIPIRPLHLIPNIPLSIEEANITKTNRSRSAETKGATRQQGPRRLQGLHGLHGAASQASSQGSTQSSYPGRPVPQVPVQAMQRTQRGPRPGGDVICKWFNTPKGCMHGDQCRFRHVVEGSRPMNSAVPTIPMRRQNGMGNPAQQRPMRRY
jgi:hypothetical protein